MYETIYQVYLDLLPCSQNNHKINISAFCLLSEIIFTFSTKMIFCVLFLLVKSGLIVFQNVLLSLMKFTLILRKYSFLTLILSFVHDNFPNFLQYYSSSKYFYFETYSSFYASVLS